MNYYRRWGLSTSFPDDPTANEMLMRRGTDSETGAVTQRKSFSSAARIAGSCARVTTRP